MRYLFLLLLGLSACDHPISKEDWAARREQDAKDYGDMLQRQELIVHTERIKCHAVGGIFKVKRTFSYYNKVKTESWSCTFKGWEPE